MGPFRRDAISFLARVAGEHGDIAYFRAGAMNIVLLNNPKYVNQVLVARQHGFVKGRPLEFAQNVLGDGLLTTDGAVHTRQRRVVQSAFHADKIKAYAIVMAEYARRQIKTWRDGETVDVAQQMRRMTLGISAKTLFNASIEEDAAQIDEAVSSAMQYFDRVSIPMVELLFKLPLPSTLRVRRAKKVLTSAVYQMIKDRRSDPRDHDDLLSLLLLASGADGLGMSDEEIRDQALVFLLAAYDTTASALAWTWYLLSQNPEAEAALQQELIAVLAGRPPTVEDVPKLKYTRAVFAEALRMYPPGYVIARRALETFELDGYTIPRGTTVLVSPYLIHRDKRFYDNPESFDPSRWNREPDSDRPKFTYFPFGGGAHVCIGDHFAWMEGVLVVATLAQQWKMSLAADQVVAYLPLINLRPKFGMRMVLRRQPNVAVGTGCLSA
jgi:cytochrome P450